MELVTEMTFFNHTYCLLSMSGEIFSSRTMPDHILNV
jgi:hypothetical protein